VREALVKELTDQTVFTCFYDQVQNYVDNVDVIVPCKAKITKELLEKCSFGFIQPFGVGTDNIDIDAAAQQGIWVSNVPAALYGNADSVAEHAIMFMLSLSRRLNFVRDEINRKRLSEPMGQAMLRKTCCLVGLGDIGVEIARRLQPFGMTLTAVRRNPSLPISADLRFEKIYSMREIDDAVANADYTVISLPHTPETHGLFSRDLLSSMKHGAYLINVGRGGVIDPDSLLDALKYGWIAGAGLDVFWEEPVDPNHPIFEYNVIATPHVAGVTDTSLTGIVMSMADNIRRFERGEMPKHVLNMPSFSKSLLKERR
jgi:phosphoglycerate dehydrogenase-like enzyme